MRLKQRRAPDRSSALPLLSTFYFLLSTLVMWPFRRCDRAHALVAELLHAGACVGFRRVDVAFGVQRYVVNRVELPGIAAAVADVIQHGQRLTEQLPDTVIGAVGHI